MLNQQRGTQSTNVLTGLLCFLCLVVAASAATAQTRTLDQRWELLVDRSANLKIADVGKSGGWRKTRVGLSWNAQFSDLRDYMGVAWYRTQLQQPNLSDGQKAMLEFGAVDYFTEVFVNG